MGLIGIIWHETFGKDLMSWNETNEEWKKLRRGGISCSECGEVNESGSNYCEKCGHKLRRISKHDKLHREFCPICREKVTKDMNYCGSHGHKINRSEKIKRCSVCGKWVGDDRYCYNCGHDFYFFNGYNRERKVHSGDLLNKRCPNCNSKQKETYQYCEYCGTKLVRK